MNRKPLVLGLSVAVVVTVSGYGLYRLGVDAGQKESTAETTAMAPPSATPQSPGDIDPAAGKRVLYWHDPMVPGQKFDKPGKSPFMDMQLVPVYADDGADDGGVTINARMQQNLGVRTARVSQGKLQFSVDAPGSVTYNDRDVVLVKARANGFVERLHVRAALERVRKGQSLADLYVPDWVAAQEEFLSVTRMQSADLTGLLDGARQRMRLAGMTDDQITQVEASGRTQPRLTITAPIGGVVTELEAREGMTIMEGMPLFRINGLATVWVNAELPESAAAQVRPGSAVEGRTSALPGKVFKGKVSAILPEVNLATRTVKARVELANPDAELVPGMFATLRFAVEGSKEVLLVPTEAVIQTGTRSVVVRTEGEGRFRPVDVEVGLEHDGQTEILSGLEAGEEVVVSGQFLIDSEASLKATGTRLDASQEIEEGAKEVSP